MRNDRLIKQDIGIISILRSGELPVKSLASALERSESWTSERVAYLDGIGLVSKKRAGNKTLVSLANSELTESLMRLMTEQPLLNLDAVLTRSSLAILPVLLAPSSVADVSKRAGLSVRTVKGLLARWRTMGVASKEGNGYAINENMKPLRSFARKYSESRNLRRLKGDYPRASIAWQWRDEFIMTAHEPVANADYVPAATTRLSELGRDIVSNVRYYRFSPERGPVSEAEALAQSLMLSPLEPRIHRLTRGYFSKAPDDREIYYYAAKYGVKQRTRELETDAGKEKVHKGRSHRSIGAGFNRAEA